MYDHEEEEDEEEKKVKSEEGRRRNVAPTRAGRFLAGLVWTVGAWNKLLRNVHVRYAVHLFRSWRAAMGGPLVEPFRVRDNGPAGPASVVRARRCGSPEQHALCKDDDDDEGDWIQIAWFSTTTKKEDDDAEIIYISPAYDHRVAAAAAAGSTDKRTMMLMTMMPPTQQVLVVAYSARDDKFFSRLVESSSTQEFRDDTVHCPLLPRPFPPSSAARLLLVEYSHPAMDAPIELAIQRQAYVVGNHLLSSLCVYRRLKHQARPFVFTRDEYRVHVVDDHLNEFVLDCHSHLRVDASQMSIVASPLLI